MKKNLYPALLIFLTLLVGCEQPKPVTVTNEKEKYSLQVLPNWNYKFQGSELVISTVKEGLMSGVIGINTLSSEYGTLNESVSNYTYDLLSFFKDASKISEGNSVINDMPVKWYRMRATQKGIKQQVLVYMIQPDDKQFISLICVAQEDKFRQFEEEFTTMIFSFKKLN